MTDQHNAKPTDTDPTDTKLSAETSPPGEAPLDLEHRLLELEQELAKATDERLRAVAELDNARKRMQRDVDESRKFAAEAVLADLLPVLDNLDMALAYAGDEEACKGFVDGVKMTRKVFLDILKSHGLTPVGSVGEDFDPQWHEAVGYEASSEVEEGRVCQLMQRGYVLKERLLRPAKVLLSKPC